MVKTTNGQGQPGVPRGLAHQPTKSGRVGTLTRTMTENDDHNRSDVVRGSQNIGTSTGTGSTSVKDTSSGLRFATWNVGSMSKRSGEVA